MAQKHISYIQVDNLNTGLSIDDLIFHLQSAKSKGATNVYINFGNGNLETFYMQSPEQIKSQRIEELKKELQLLTNG